MMAIFLQTFKISLQKRVRYKSEIVTMSSVEECADVSRFAPIAHETDAG